MKNVSGILLNMVLRPAQERILAYRGNRMAISAVPGSGKTFTLSLLAAELIRQETIRADHDQQILVVTYLNSSVETFRATIRQRLSEFDLPHEGYEVRTLHSLALEIVRLAIGGSALNEPGPDVADETQALTMIGRATDSWIEANPEIWAHLLADDRPNLRVRWRDLLESTARRFIHEAKNSRYSADDIWRQLQELVQVDPNTSQLYFSDADASGLYSKDQLLLLLIMAGIYRRYQSMLDRLGASDFDDLIWQAAELLKSQRGLAVELRQRWPFILEDEAQDSVPLQESLLASLTGPAGNWVRVGDPNQAITSTFTSAHPRHFSAFVRSDDVVALPLPNSGRCAPLIYGAANFLVNWVCDNHPVPEVRANTFVRQMILPTPPGDSQPNPLDTEAEFHIKVFRHREDEELPTVARRAHQYAIDHNEHSLAILAPTNQLGHELANQLDALGADYDNLLRSGGRQREIAAALHALMALIANPIDTRALEAVYASLVDLEHPVLRAAESVDHRRVRTLLRSVHRPEMMLYVDSDDERISALPAGVASEEEKSIICSFARFVQRLDQYRLLAVDDMLLALSDELFTRNELREPAGLQSDLAVAYQLAAAVRQWWDMQPEWRLPELAAQLSDVAMGRRRLVISGPGMTGFKPQPGRITLATQHGAKGMEWDAVFLVGMDSRWIPADLDSHFLGFEPLIGGDPAAEVIAALHYLMEDQERFFDGRTATESAHIEVISERLRLLYVGITRARRFLHISRSRSASGRRHDFETGPATVLGIIYRFLKASESSA